MIRFVAFLSLSAMLPTVAPLAAQSLLDRPANISTLIAIRDFSFQANDVHIKAGSSVTWVNCEPAGTTSHTSTSDQGAWQSPLLAPGETFTQTFDTPGVFSYHCTPHPFMTGRVTVE